LPEAEKSKKNKMPKGGRKGRTSFPRLDLKQALDYAEKLVGKTHTGPQPATTILPGVFGNAGPEGGVRASALKQYGLLEGPPNAYEGTKLAKDIVAAPPEDQRPLLQRAFLNSKLFAKIFETYHGDSVTKARIRQRALALKVHPDSADECVNLFVASVELAGLGTPESDGIKLERSGGTAVGVPGDTEADTDNNISPDANDDGPVSSGSGVAVAAGGGEEGAGAATTKVAARGARASVTVNLNVDSSSDPDKLEKQLKLLKDFGMI
jgi:hypothetical protein